MKPRRQQKLTAQQINELPLSRWRGPIYLITEKKKAEQAASYISVENIVGFDTETKPVFKKGHSNLPNLMQLATSREVFIFVLKKTGLTSSLLEILKDRSIKKVGVALQDDLRELNKIKQFLPEGFIDLSQMSQKQKMKHHGLRGLAALMLGVRISKSQRTSNWARKNLSTAQVIYAATDAWISRRIYEELCRNSTK